MACLHPCIVGCRCLELTGQFKASSPDLTLNGGLSRGYYQDGLKLGIEIISSYPELRFRVQSLGLRV